LNNRVASAPAAPPPLETRQQAAKGKSDNIIESVAVTDDEVITTDTSSRAAKTKAGSASAAARREMETPLGMTATAPRARRSSRDDGDAGGRAKEADARAVSRIVRNRRFTRRGSVWVDGNYKEGTTVTNVRRGSEQFRALVADEPDMRRVAETLSGEVIVVAKNRAYRIQ
jgi:hypothetical protein